MPPELDLFKTGRGSVTAPAGCGKTQLIADTLQEHREAKPILVLTHTNAGVAALKARLQRAGVTPASYRVLTIDGFAMRMVSKFPARSALDPTALALEQPRRDYPAIRLAASQMLAAGHINDALRATYAGLIVDEYQDCSTVQHAIVNALSVNFPTCVLGDPMQAIFGFAGNALVRWDTEVQRDFPSVGELRTAWRWRNAGAEEFGNWLLRAREELAAGGGVELTGAPAEVTWVRLTRENAVQQRLAAAATRPPQAGGSVLVLGDSMNVRGRHQLASQVPGAVTVETVDLRDLTAFAAGIDANLHESSTRVVQFASEVMTGVGAGELLRRTDSLRRGTARNAATAVETALLHLHHIPTLRNALAALACISEDPGVRVYRPELLRACMTALQAAAESGCSFSDAAVRVREQNRHGARRVSRRAVGSTLLLKGLEADVAVVLHPENMDARHLYVAMTRGARRLVVCSETPLLVPQGR